MFSINTKMNYNNFSEVSCFFYETYMKVYKSFLPFIHFFIYKDNPVLFNKINVVVISFVI